MIRLQEKYKKEVVPLMIEKFGYKSAMAVPGIVKVVVNTGFGRIITGTTGDEQKKALASIMTDLSLITGQKPTLKRTKKSISGFKVRKGMTLGATVNLRKKKMYDFLERLINIVLPRERDFAGIKEKSIDRNGNLTYGIKEHTIFPEISPEKIRNIFGLEVTVVTSAKNQKEALELLRLMGFPMQQSMING